MATWYGALVQGGVETSGLCHPPTVARGHSRGTVDFDHFDALTFDCYGTLIDWETGILAALKAASAEEWPASDDDLLERFAVHESRAERGEYRSYRQVLAETIRGVATDYGVPVSDEAVGRFSLSVGDWPPFPDSSAALARLARRFSLGVITNCDRDLFAASNQRLGVRFDWVITADQVRSYKPSLKNFEQAFATIPVPRERILHVAQSLYHDHVPAKKLGMTTAWIDRRQDRPGSGATPPAQVEPDMTVPSMAALAYEAAPELEPD
ncbi:MAG TPA: haloacid dehalogenase type II [Actinomycetota bacterium]|nr:haloacid dehalogenase type II [Actinomycetota bacterium]